MNENDKNLLPCPFCGNSKVSGHSLDQVRMRQQEITELGFGIKLEKPEQRFFVKCGRCGACGGLGQSGRVFGGSIVTVERAEAIAREKWNRRTAADHEENRMKD